MAAFLQVVGELLRALGLVTDSCFTTLFAEANLLDEACLKALISKGLGYAMTMFSAIVKMPQVVTMLTNKTAVGVSRTSVYIETVMYGACATYGVIVGNPFSAYGENVMLIIQVGPPLPPPPPLYLRRAARRQPTFTHVGMLTRLHARAHRRHPPEPDDCHSHVALFEDVGRGDRGRVGRVRCTARGRHAAAGRVRAR